jgi:hypothetical protein
MAQDHGATFTNESVVLGGNDYRNCTFTNCEIVIRGTVAVSPNEVPATSYETGSCEAGARRTKRLSPASS